MAQAEHKRSAEEGRDPAVVEKSRLAVGKGCLVGGMVTLAVAESRGYPVAVENKVIPAVTGMVVGHSQAEDPHTRIRPEVVETGRAY